VKFSTYGPFQLTEMSPEGVRALFESINATKANLQYAIGVYIFATMDSKGKLIPWYVGKTDKGFGRRLRNHLDAGKFHHLQSDSGPISVFLIARVTPSGRLKKKVTGRTRGRSGLKSIDRLEFALIGTCLLLNTDLMNKSEKNFHTSMHVPGYLNSPVSSRNKSATELAKMLGT
jgi:hypothetical protein